MAHKDTEIARMIMRKNDDSCLCCLPVVVVRCGCDEWWMDEGDDDRDKAGSRQ